MRFNCPTSFVVSCQVPDRAVSSWIFSTMRLMLFFDGRYPRPAWPVLAEYIRPNVYPRKSNSPSGILQIRVLSSLIVSPSLTMISRNRCKASSALPLLPQDHEVIGVSHDASAKASLQSELVPSQHEPAHVEIGAGWDLHPLESAASAHTRSRPLP